MGLLRRLLLSVVFIGFSQLYAAFRSTPNAQATHKSSPAVPWAKAQFLVLHSGDVDEPGLFLVARRTGEIDSSRTLGESAFGRWGSAAGASPGETHCRRWECPLGTALALRTAASACNSQLTFASAADLEPESLRAQLTQGGSRNLGPATRAAC